MRFLRGVSGGFLRLGFACAFGGDSGGFFKISKKYLFEPVHPPLLLQFGGGPLGEYLAGMHQRYAIATLSLIHEMRGDEDGDSLFARELDQEFPESVAGNRVDP